MILDFLEGKKTYIGILATLISLITGVSIADGDLTIVLNQLQVIIAAIGVIISTIGRFVART